MEYAIYLNGVYEDGLRQIIGVHHREPDRTCYLQPHGSNVIKRFQEESPSNENIVPIYMSVTTNLADVTYVADVVGWRQKSELNDNEVQEMNEHIRRYQSLEQSIYFEINGKKPVNLILVKRLRRLRRAYPTSMIKKLSDGQPLGQRTQSGNYSYVHPIDIVEESESELSIFKMSDLEHQFNEGFENSIVGSKKERSSRLKSADQYPEKLLIQSVGYLSLIHI